MTEPTSGRTPSPVLVFARPTSGTKFHLALTEHPGSGTRVAALCGVQVSAGLPAGSDRLGVCKRCLAAEIAPARTPSELARDTP